MADWAIELSSLCSCSFIAWLLGLYGLAACLNRQGQLETPYQAKNI